MTITARDRLRVYYDEDHTGVVPEELFSYFSVETMQEQILLFN